MRRVFFARLISALNMTTFFRVLKEIGADVTPSGNLTVNVQELFDLMLTKAVLPVSCDGCADNSIFHNLLECWPQREWVFP